MSNLTASSALVMRWVKEENIFSEEVYQNYIQKLDLKIGEKLYRICQNIFPHYHKIIQFRKLYILTHIKELIKKEKIKQVVILAAGIDPLGLELQLTFPKIKIFEIDRDEMLAKREFYHQLGCRNVLIQMDIQTTNVKKELIKKGFSDCAPSIIILEGISYYLTLKDIQEIFSHFSQSYVLMDYLLPRKEITQRAYSISFSIFNAIVDANQIRRLTHLEILQNKSLTLLDRKNIFELEKKYQGKNQIFQRAKEAWIELAQFKLK